MVWVVNATPWPAYPRGTLGTHLYRRLGGPQDRSGRVRKISASDQDSFPGRINPLKPELNPICYLLALLAQHFLHVSRIRVKSLTLR